MKFKVGDKVRYVREGPIERTGKDWAKIAGCKLGRIYTVVKLWGSSGIRVDVNGRESSTVCKDRFELAPTCKLNRRPSNHG